LWSVATGKQLYRRKKGDSVYSHHLSENGKILAYTLGRPVANKSIFEAKAVEIETGKELGAFEILQNLWTRAAIAPDGKTMVSWGEHKAGVGTAKQIEAQCTVQVWDIAAGKERHKLQLGGPMEFVRISAAAYSPDGKTLAVASNLPAVYLFDLET